MNKKVAALALLIALGAPAAAGVQKAPVEGIVPIAADDAEMNAAKARAIAELPNFYRRLAAPAADESEFAVKFDIDPTDEVEYVWAVDLDRSGRTMTGELVNQPINTDHRRGDRVAIPESSIADWSYRRGGVTQGSYTDRVLLGRMPADQAAQYRQFLGW